MTDVVTPIRFVIKQGNTAVAAEDAATVAYPHPEANSWVNIAGPDPGYAHLYLRRENLNKIDRNSVTTTLKIIFGSTVKEVKNLRFVRAERLSPGDGNQLQALWLATFADARVSFLAGGIRHHQHYRYNVRVPGRDANVVADQYYRDSSRPGGTDVPWTWSQMCEHIWGSGIDEGLDDQVFPGLPFTPHGTPENFVVDDGWEDFHKVLARIACALVFTESTGQFSIVRLGSTDATFDGQLTSNSASLRSHDDPVVGKVEVPGTVAIRFRKWWHQYGNEKTAEDTGQDNWAAEYLTSDKTAKFIDKVVTDVGYTTANAVVGLWGAIFDDMCEDGVNDTAARATERATDFYRDALTTKRNRWYYGIVDFAVGSICKLKMWSSLSSDMGEPRTRIVTGPGMADLHGVLKPNLWQLQPPDFTQFAWPQYHDLLQQVQLTSTTPDSNDLYDAALVNVDATATPPTKSTTTTVKLRFSDAIHVDANNDPIVTLASGMVFLARRTGTFNTGAARKQLYTAEPIRPALRVRDVNKDDENDASAAYLKEHVTKILVNKETALKVKTPAAGTGNTAYAVQIEGNQTWANLQSPAITISQVDTVNSDEDIEFEDTTGGALNPSKVKIKTRGLTEDHPAGKALVYADFRRGLVKDASTLWVTYAADHTIPLAKITAKGTDGSLTWTYGHITAYVDPT